jgi:hypothetical protein
MTESDYEYLRVRAAQERAHAEQAPNELVREIHLKLAREYEVRAIAGETTSEEGNKAFGKAPRG